MSTISLCRSPLLDLLSDFSINCLHFFFMPRLFAIVTNKGHSGLTHVDCILTVEYISSDCILTVEYISSGSASKMIVVKRLSVNVSPKSLS